MNCIRAAAVGPLFVVELKGEFKSRAFYKGKWIKKTVFVGGGVPDAPCCLIKGTRFHVKKKERE